MGYVRKYAISDSLRSRSVRPTLRQAINARRAALFKVVDEQGTLREVRHVCCVCVLGATGMSAQMAETKGSTLCAATTSAAVIQYTSVWGVWRLRGAGKGAAYIQPVSLGGGGCEPST